MLKSSLGTKWNVNRDNASPAIADDISSLGTKGNVNY